MTTQFGPKYVRAMAPYLAGKPVDEVAREFGLDPANIVKLASNENPLGAPASSIAAMAEAMAGIAQYPDASGYALKGALARRYNVPEQWLTVGNGSNDILEIIAHASAAPGNSVVYSQYAFAVYSLATQALGARPIVVPAHAYGHDLEAMLAAIDDDTRLVFVANPNNPTGTFLPADAISRFLARVPAHVVVVLDEAYNEFLDASLQFDSTRWVGQYPNLVVVRTFSKAYGLAGLRVGFAISQEPLTDLMNRIRQPFNVNALAQTAAIAALSDSDYLRRSAANNRAGYSQLTKAFHSMGLKFLPSHGNFVLVRVGDDAAAGARINHALLQQGVIVRPVANYGLPEWLRISIGLPHENQKLISALGVALAGAGAPPASLEAGRRR